MGNDGGLKKLAIPVDEINKIYDDLDTNKDGGLDKKELEAGNVSRASATRDLRDADIDL